MNLPFAPSSVEKEELYESWKGSGWHFTYKERGPDGKTRLRGVESAEDIANLLFIVSQSREVTQAPKYAEIPGNGSSAQCYGHAPDYMDFLKVLRTHHPDELRAAATGLLAGLSDPASPLSFQEKSDLFFYLCITPGMGSMDIGRPFIDKLLRYAETMDPDTVGPDRAAHRAVYTGLVRCLSDIIVINQLRDHLGYKEWSSIFIDNPPVKPEHFSPVYADLLPVAVQAARTLADTCAPGDERLPDNVWQVLHSYASDNEISASAAGLTRAHACRMREEWEKAVKKADLDYKNIAEREGPDYLVAWKWDEEFVPGTGGHRQLLRHVGYEYLDYLETHIKNPRGQDDVGEATLTAQWKPLQEQWNIDRSYARAVPGSQNVPAVDLEGTYPEIAALRREVLNHPEVIARRRALFDGCKP